MSEPGQEIVAENVRLAGAMITAALLDELKAFQVADRIVELAQRGMLPIQGTAGKKLDAYWREKPNRLSAAERRDVYGLTLGIVGGEPAGAVNRDFDALWLRFVAAVAAVPRQEAPVREAGRKLVAKLAQHRFGPGAQQLSADVESVVSLLREPEIRRAFGARDMWQLIDRVAADQLGGARNSARHRRLGKYGTTIVAWLAANLPRIKGEKGPLPDEALVAACGGWLADAGGGARKRR